jgi:hypothetical protein
MAEIVGAFLRADVWDERVNRSLQGAGTVWGDDLAQELLEFAVTSQSD